MQSGAKPISINNQSGKEVERRFLVRRYPENLDAYEHHELSTGYFFMPGDRFFRVRRADDEYTMTFKSGTGIERTELPSIRLDKETFDALFAQTDPESRSEKTRYLIPWNDLIIELNVYHGQLSGFANAEIELKSKDQKMPALPDWIGEEITSNEKLTNNLTNREYVLAYVAVLRRKGESV